jgi:hypothetical protein
MFPLSIKNSLTAVIAIFFLVLFSCGSKPKKKEVVIKKDKNTHELALTGRNNLKGTLYVDTILDKKKRKKWRIQLSLTADSISPKKFVWYKDSLEDGLTKVLKQCMLVPFQRPKSANFEFAEDHFELVEAVPGSMIDTAALRLQMRRIQKEKQLLLDLDRADLYVQPTYDNDNPATEEGKKALDKCLQSVINIRHEEKTAKLDYKKFGAWLHLDTSMKVVIDTLPFQEFIEEVALKMDAPLSDFLNKEPTETETVLDTLQEEPMIPRINVYKEMAAIAKLIPLGKKSTYTLAFSSVPVLQGFKNGKTSFVEVSLSDQKLWLFKNGCLILETDVVTGNKKTGHLTPKGNYSVRHKTKDRVLRGPDYAAFVRYWMPFYNGYGLHDADWRRSFGGTIWERSGSHGCVNMPVRNAPIVYANVKVGTTVIVR